MNKVPDTIDAGILQALEQSEEPMAVGDIIRWIEDRTALTMVTVTVWRKINILCNEGKVEKSMSLISLPNGVEKPGYAFVINEGGRVDLQAYRKYYSNLLGLAAGETESSN